MSQLEQASSWILQLRENTASVRSQSRFWNSLYAKTNNRLHCWTHCGILGTTSFHSATAILGRSSQKLIADWRSIQPGMTVAEVTARLGVPNGTSQQGNRFLNSRHSLSLTSTNENHSVSTYVIPLLKPQVLLIYFDADGAVSFVSSSST